MLFNPVVYLYDVYISFKLLHDVLLLAVLFCLNHHNKLACIHMYSKNFNKIAFF